MSKALFPPYRCNNGALFPQALFERQGSVTVYDELRFEITSLLEDRN